MKRKTLLLIFIPLTAAILSVITFGSGVFKNIEHKNGKIPVSVTAEKTDSSDFNTINEAVIRGDLYCEKLKSMYDVQMVRKTFQGYYAVIPQNDGKRIFVFMDDNLKARKVIAFDEFKSKKYFDFLKPGKTVESEVLSRDKSTIPMPISAYDCTVHIVKEGALFIKYKRIDMETGEFLNEHPVESVEFFDNKDLKAGEGLCRIIPYILEEDKI